MSVFGPPDSRRLYAGHEPLASWMGSSAWSHSHPSVSREIFPAPALTGDRIPHSRVHGNTRSAPGPRLARRTPPVPIRYSLPPGTGGDGQSERDDG